MGTEKEKQPSNAELTKILRNAAQKLPYAERQHIDISRLKAQLVTGAQGQNWKRAGHIAAVQNGSRDTVSIIDPETFMAHPTQLTAHEVAHLIQNSLSPEDQSMFAANATTNPYNYGGTQGLIQARAQGKKIHDFSPEQQAEMIQYAQAHEDNYDQGSPEGKAQWDAQKPVYDSYINDMNNWKVAPNPNLPDIKSDNDPNLHTQFPVQTTPPSGTIPPAQVQPVQLADQSPRPAQPTQTVQTGTFATNVYQFGDAAPGEPSSPPSAVTFDSPQSQATTITVPAPAQSAPNSSADVPAGVTFDGPLQSATTVKVPFAPVSSQTVTNTQAVPQATINATSGSMPNDPMAAKIQNWSNNVASDLLHGTNITGVGKFLRSLNAHGFETSVSPQVATFMGSLPLGLLRATKGAAELPQSGQRWQGTKDVAGGLLDAATIPGSFVAPEAGELAGQGINEAGNIASKAAQAIKAPFTLESIQPELQQGIRDAVNGAAQELGVQPSASASIRDVANDVAQAAKAKAGTLYRQLDAAVGNTRFQAYQEQLDDALNELRNSISEADPDAHGELIDKINNLESAKSKAYQSVKDAGLDPHDIYAKAQNLWRRGSALEDLGSHVEKSTTGMRPELAADAAKTNAETVSTTKLFNRANQMYNDGRLQVAVGEQKAKQLLQAVDSAHLRALKVAANQRYTKLAGKIALYGGGYEALRHGASHLLGD